LRARRRTSAIGKNWYCDETKIKIGKQWYYLYRAIDNFGNLGDVRLSKTRDLEAAKGFFGQALQKSPEKGTTAKHSSNPKAIKKVPGRKVEHRNTKYLNNFREQDHRGIKTRIKPMLGFKKFERAERFCQVFDEQRQYFRYREVKLDPEPLKRQRHLFRLYIQKKFEAA
jgi:transposase-like protein